MVQRIALLFSLAAVACGPPQPSQSGGGGDRNRDAGAATPGADAGSSVLDAGSPQADAGAVVPTSPLIDPQCLDGQYRETLPPANADISALSSDYSPDAWRAYVEGVLRARYPLGWTIVEDALVEAPDQLGDCLDAFVRDRSSPSAIDRQMGTFVHECGHFLDIGLGFSRGRNVFVVREDLTLECTQGDTTDRRGRTFARSRIRDDRYADLRPPCARGEDCDTYANIYLSGDPDDQNFDSGDQGFNMLMEEAFQYVNSLATNYALNERYQGSISGRDGILTTLWWVQRYLAMARADYPAAHEFILGDPCWRQAILTLWGRAWLYLEATEDMNQLGIRDDAIMELVEDPDLLGEIQSVREAHGCR